MRVTTHDWAITRGRCLIRALAVLLLVPLSATVAQPIQQPMVEAIKPKLVEVVGDVCVESSDSRVELVLAEGPAGSRTQTDRLLKTIVTTVLNVNANGEATRLLVHFRRLRKIVLENGKEIERADALEGKSTVLLDRGAIEEFRGKPLFPLPQDAIKPGDSWRLSGMEALEVFGGDGVYTAADAELSLVSVGLSAEGEPVARIRRVLTRQGQAHGAPVSESGDGTMRLNAKTGRPLEYETRAEIQTTIGTTKAVGVRVVRAVFAYSRVEVFALSPRAEVGVTQTERSTSVTRFTLTATPKARPAQARTLTRHLESTVEIERHALAVTPDGIPTRYRMRYIHATKHARWLDARGETLAEEAEQGPLHGLSVIVERSGNGTGERRVQDLPALRQQIAAALRARDPKRQVSDPELNALTTDVAAMVERTNEPLAGLMLPSFSVPVGYAWALPEATAKDVFRDLLAGMRLNRISATATFADVASWGGRPKVAKLLTVLSFSATTPDGVTLEADLPTLTYFDLDMRRPLTVRGEGQLVLTQATPELDVTGRGTVAAQTTFVYDAGPNIAADGPFIGKWAFVKNGKTDPQYQVEFLPGGKLTFTRPNLATKEPITTTGQWQIRRDTPPVTVEVVLSGAERDVFEVTLSGSGETMKLKRIEDTARRTGIFPWLVNGEADYTRIR